jgi:RNA polymerase sigma-70 factor (ECF subfamily)
MANGGNDGGEAWVQDLYVRYYKRVVYFFRNSSFRFSLEDARDLAQDVFLSVYKARDQYRREAELGYIMTIARRVALNRLRANRAGSRDAIVESIDDVLEGPVEAPRQERDLETSRLKEAIAKLRHHLRICLLLYLDGFQYAEIAAVLHLSVDGVRSRLKEARVLLRQMLVEEPSGIVWPSDLPEDER